MTHGGVLPPSRSERHADPPKPSARSLEDAKRDPADD
jgi:hypothetical protein